MAQVKKDKVRDAILRAASVLFEKKGYSDTTLRAIARRVDLSLANIYVYFDSKLDIVFALFEPWFRQRIEHLEAQAAKTLDPEKRLKLILRTLWCDIPGDHGGFAVNVMQALATTPEGYSPALIEWAKERVSRLVDSCMSGKIDRPPDFSLQVVHIMFMALDGFSINFRLNKNAACSEDMLNAAVMIFSALCQPSTTVNTAKPVRRPKGAQSASSNR